VYIVAKHVMGFPVYLKLASGQTTLYVLA